MPNVVIVLYCTVPLLLQLPKYKLLLGAALGKKWEEAEVLRPLEELSVAEIRAFEDYRRAVVEERTLDPLRVRHWHACTRRTGSWLCMWKQQPCIAGCTSAKPACFVSGRCMLCLDDRKPVLMCSFGCSRDFLAGLQQLLLACQP